MQILNKLFILLILITIFSLSCSASSTGYMGDLNNDMYFNSIDISLFKKKLQSNNVIPYSEILDINVDGKITIKDLVRMKKYLVSDIAHVNKTEKGLSWVLLDGEGDLAIITGIGYMFSTTCYTKTVCAPGRCVWESSAFIKTDRYLNPEYPTPLLTISNTTINNEIVNMTPYNNVIVNPDWIWNCSFSEDILYVPLRSEFNCLFTIMLNDSPYPYKELEINFNF